MPIFTSIGLALGATVAASTAGIGAFGVGVAATALAGAAVGYSSSQTRQAKKSASTQASIAASTMPTPKSILDTSGIATPGAPAEPAAAIGVAAAKKTQAVTKQKRQAISRSRTIFTSPLGLREEATVARKTLLGH